MKTEALSQQLFAVNQSEVRPHAHARAHGRTLSGCGELPAVSHRAEQAWLYSQTQTDRKTDRQTERPTWPEPLLQHCLLAPLKKSLLLNSSENRPLVMSHRAPIPLRGECPHPQPGAESALRLFFFLPTNVMRCDWLGRRHLFISYIIIYNFKLQFIFGIFLHKEKKTASLHLMLQLRYICPCVQFDCRSIPPASAQLQLPASSCRGHA